MTNLTDPSVPSLLLPLSTDEYSAPHRSAVQRRATVLFMDRGAAAAERTGVPIAAYAASRRGTAAGLASLNEATGAKYYEVPPDAALDESAAEAAFAADGPVVDVQTHWIADRPSLQPFQKRLLSLYRHFAPDWWTGLNDVIGYSMAEYMRCVFVESETALAVISAAPGNREGDMMLRNDEMAGMRELFDRMGGTGRLINHTVVRPNLGEIEHMAMWAEVYGPVGWKVYTLGAMNDDHSAYIPGTGWRLDDEESGLPFLEKAQACGVSLVSAHKGVSGVVDCSAPDDIGPAARAFPDITFVVYHLGYEPGMPEGAYVAEGDTLGIDTLIRTRSTMVSVQAETYAELGTTWFNLLSKPEEAAHALGKLLLHLGEDNIIWGSDAVWYGPTQPAVDAFRSFQIPDRMCEQNGYPKLTPRSRRKILCENAARVYGLDVTALNAARTGDLAWSEAVLGEYGRHGLVPDSLR